MLKDITIGQYFPGNSIIHRLDAGVKIIITILYIMMIFTASTFPSAAVGVIFMIIEFILTGISFKVISKSLKPVIPVLIITAVLNIFLFEGETVFKFAFINITDKGIKNSAFMFIRVISLIIGSSVLTYTTSPIELTNAIEKLLSPLKKLKFPAHELAMMMTIALRFIPTLIEETDKIISAQKARGADFENGSIKERAGAIVPVIVPLFVSAFKRAEDLAVAMECRCYKGGDGRTKLHQSKIKISDVVAVFFTVIFFAAIIVINYLFKK